MAKIRAMIGSGGGSFNAKVIEPTVVVGQNTIETGVAIKQIMYVWQKANGSDDKYINGQWSDIRPNETWISYSTTGTANGKRTVPNSQSTNIQSVSGTSFTFGVGQNDYNLFNGSPLRFYIYY